MSNSNCSVAQPQPATGTALHSEDSESSVTQAVSDSEEVKTGGGNIEVHILE